MKNKVAEAVGYGIKALKMSPSEFFKVLEEINSNYKEQKYSHWLAKEIVKYAEENGVPYNEIFTKRVRILHDLSNESDVQFNEFFTEGIKTIRDNNYQGYELISLTKSITLDKNAEFCNDGGIDLNEDNLLFLDGVDPIFRDSVVGNKKSFLFFNVGNKPINKNHPLAKNAKQFNIQLGDEFDLLLYRLVTVVSAVDCPNVKFAIVSDGKDFANLSKVPLYDLFMQYLKCEDAFLFNPLDVSDSMVNEGYYLLSVWSTDATGNKDDVSYLGLRDSKCIADVVEDDGLFNLVDKKTFTFPNKVLMKPKKVNNFEEYKEECIYNVAQDLLKSSIGFKEEIRQPVTVLEEYKMFESNALILNTFSDKGNTRYFEDVIDLFEDKYSMLTVEAISLLEFCKGALKKADSIGLDTWKTMSDIISEFNNENISNEYLSRLNKMKNSIISMGYLDCFLV